MMWTQSAAQEEALQQPKNTKATDILRQEPALGRGVGILNEVVSSSSHSYRVVVCQSGFCGRDTLQDGLEEQHFWKRIVLSLTGGGLLYLW